MDFNDLINNGWARLFRFGLRRCLVALALLVSPPLAAQPYHVANQADIDAMPADTKHVVCDQRVTDSVLRGLVAAKELEELDLYHCREITSGGLQPLWRLKKLRRLNLDMCRQLADSTLSVLASFESLEELNLHQGVLYTNEGMAHLAKLKNLRAINLGMFWAADEKGLEHVLTLPKLDTLELRMNGWVGDAVLARIVEAVPALTKLNLVECKSYTAKGLAHLTRLSKLVWLNVGGHKALDGAAIEELGKLKHLRHLNLIQFGLQSDEDIAPLKALTELRYLGVEAMINLTGACFKNWDLPHLEELELKRNSLSGEGMRFVSRFKSLKRLYIWYQLSEDLDSEALASIGELKQLEFLSIWLDTVNDKTMQVVGSLPALSQLHLTGANLVTDAGFAQLKSAKALRLVRVLMCEGISDAATERLRKDLPQCKVLRKEDP